jgi:hypothetical protein
MFNLRFFLLNGLSLKDFGLQLCSDYLPIPTACPAHFISLDIITATTFGGEYMISL